MPGDILKHSFRVFSSVTTKMKYNGLSEPKARHAIPDVDSVKGGSSLPLTESSILIKSEQHRHRQVIRCCADAKEKDPTW